MTTIDCTPTWIGLLPLLMEQSQSRNQDVRSLANEELKRMASLADAYRELTKAATDPASTNISNPELKAAIESANSISIQGNGMAGNYFAVIKPSVIKTLSYLDKHCTIDWNYFTATKNLVIHKIDEN